MKTVHDSCRQLAADKAMLPIGQLINTRSPLFSVKEVYIRLFEETPPEKPLEESSEEPRAVPTPNQLTKLEASKYSPEPCGLLEMGVLERNAFWAQQREKSLQTKRQNQSQQELRECSFKPATLAYSPSKPSPRPVCKIQRNSYLARGKHSRARTPAEPAQASFNSFIEKARRLRNN